MDRIFYKWKHIYMDLYQKQRLFRKSGSMTSLFGHMLLYKEN